MNHSLNHSYEHEPSVSSGVQLSTHQTGAVLREALNGQEMPVMFAQYDVHEQATIQTTMKLDTALMSEVYSLADQYYEQMSSGESSILPIKQFLLRTQAITTALRDLYGEPCRDSDAVQEYFEQYPRVSLSQTLAQGLAQCPVYGWLGCAYLQRCGFDAMAVVGYEDEHHAYSLVAIDGRYARVCTTNPLSYDPQTQTYQPNVARVSGGSAIAEARESMHDARIVQIDGSGQVVESGETTRVGIAA